MKVDDNTKTLAKLEKAIGYSFNSKELLRQAFVHKSYKYEHSLPDGADNEKLEFFGDSILGFIISHILYQRLSGIEVGTLAKMKSYLVSSKNLYSLAKRLNLGEYLLLSKGEEVTKGRKKQSLLVDSYEALIAVIYLDGGLSAAEKFIISQFRAIIEDLINQKAEFRDYKSMLQEYLQSLKLSEPLYRVVKQEGPDHRRSYLVELIVEGQPLVQAKGKSKKEAEESAADKGLKILKKSWEKSK